MATTDDPDHHDRSAEPVTDRVHDNSWSANLEKPRHADDPELVIEQAVEAIEHTAPGNHVNLVTHGDHGHPADYLYPALAELDDTLDWTYVEQCGCGGHVTRAHVK
jgi:putative CGCGG family rSAM target protein